MRHDVARARPLPLIVGLHFGWRGELSPRQGRDFLRLFLEPAAAGIDAVLASPTCPRRTWHDPRSEEAVLALIDDLLVAGAAVPSSPNGSGDEGSDGAPQERVAVDPERVLLVGYSLGGMGAWHLAVREPGRFRLVVPVASVPILQRGEDGGRGLAEMERLAAGGELPWREELTGVAVRAVHSRDDELVPFERVRRALDELRDRGADVELVALEGVGHHDAAAHAGAVRRLLRRCLP